MCLKSLQKLARITLGQSLTLNFGQKLTYEMTRVGPEPGLTASLYVCMYIEIYVCGTFRAYVAIFGVFQG